MTTKSRIVLAALGALSLSSGVMGAPAAEPPPLVKPTLAPADKVTLQKLHDGDQMQMQMGKLAQDKGSTRAVRDLGLRLANDSAVAEQKIDAYLRTRGADITALAATTSADTDHALLAARLGLDFDRAFIQQTVQDLQDTIDLLGNARVETADDTLRLLYDELSQTVTADKKAAEDLLTGMTRS
jgi:predicted outer membrane protein